MCVCFFFVFFFVCDYLLVFSFVPFYAYYCIVLLGKIQFDLLQRIIQKMKEIELKDWEKKAKGEWSYRHLVRVFDPAPTWVGDETIILLQVYWPHPFNPQSYLPWL